MTLRPPPSVDRLRARPMASAFHVVLVEPEIPPNTGNIARLCAATACPLHLVGKLGFDIGEHAVRRAGLDYWHLVDVRTHPELVAAEDEIFGADRERARERSWLFSAKATRSYLDVRFTFGDALIFGKESVGLPQELLDSRPARIVGIPTIGAVRSLNLANAVAIALFEALRQNGALSTDVGGP